MLLKYVARIIMLCTLALGWPAMAMQPGRLIADLVEYSDVRAVVPSTTAATFTRVMNANPEQQAAAILLVESARTDVARIVNRHLRTVRDDPTLQQILDSEQRVLQTAAAIELQLLTDLRTIVTPEQEPLYPKFERAHRRSLLRLAPPQPMPVDLWSFFSANNFDASKDETLSNLLDKFDVDSDAALVRQRRALKTYYASVRLGFDGSEEARQRDRAAQNELLAANGNLNRVFASVVERLITALPPDLTNKLVLEIIERSIVSFDKNLSNPERYPVVREVLALELTQEQRRSIQSVLEAAKSEALAQARSTVIEQAKYVLLDNKTRTDGRTAPLNLYLGAASKLRVRVSSELLSILTPLQRLAYDASAVIDPPSTSSVNDE